MTQLPANNTHSADHGLAGAGRRKARICIIAQNAYGALSGGRTGHIGGAEHQTSFLARWLAARGHQVSFITWDEGQPDNTVFDGVRVVKMCRLDAGLPGIRFLHPRVSSLLAAARRADAEVYYHNSAEHMTGVLAWWCRRNGRKFVYSVASNVACEASLPALKKQYERFLYRYGVVHADRVIVQSKTQQSLLQEGFGKSSVILPMPCGGPSEAEYAANPAPALDSVSWVGRADGMKRLEWILEIAERLPQVRFQLAVANQHRCPNGGELHQRATRLPNVTWRWNVERAAIAEIYRSTACLCCTSSYEGFPNTFLEAWSHGRPLVTSFDPDGLVARLNLGCVATTVDGFVQAITDLFASKGDWQTKAHNARRYYAENHRAEVAMPLIERELLTV